MGKNVQQIFFLFFPEEGFDISYKLGDSLHEMLKPVLWEKYFKMSSPEIFTQPAKH